MKQIEAGFSVRASFFNTPMFSKSKKPVFVFSCSLLMTGCVNFMTIITPVAKQQPLPPVHRPTGGIILWENYYIGMFGDDQKVWSGESYRENNLSIIAHLPSRSEFFISVQEAPRGHFGITNSLHAIIEGLRSKVGAPASDETWCDILQPISIRSKYSTNHIHYLTTEFTGHRWDSDRYPKSDQVVVKVYVGCLNPQRGNDALYSVAFAMIPIDVPREERERLTGILDDFLRNQILYEFY